LVKKRMIEAQRGGTHKSNLAKLLVTFSISSRHGIDVQQNLGYAKDEFDILAAANSLDQDALAAIFDEYAPAIYKYLLRLGVYPQEADQIVGDVFARLLDKITEGKGPRTNLRSYLFQIAYHLAVDHARERQRTASLDMADSVNDENKPVQSRAEEKMMLEKLSSVMERELTEDQRSVIVLRFQEDFSLKETAEILGKNVNAVKALQNRGIDKLRQAMGRLSEEF
jgi:RNA polymerase sigma factor (sigma-70 family)